MAASRLEMPERLPSTLGTEGDSTVNTTHESSGWANEAAGDDPERIAFLNRIDPVLAAARARQTRSAKIEALVLLALGNATCHAGVLAVHPRFRPRKVRAHLNQHHARYGIPEDGAPSTDSIKAVLERHGYMNLVTTTPDNDQ